MAVATLAQMASAAVGLASVVSMFWWRRPKGRIADDPEVNRRQAEISEMERRLASYLAARDDTKSPYETRGARDDRR